MRLQTLQSFGQECGGRSLGAEFSGIRSNFFDRTNEKTILADVGYQHSACGHNGMWRFAERPLIQKNFLKTLSARRRTFQSS